MMNDEQLKKLIKDDHSQPEAPVNEWTQIKSQISSQESEGLSISKIAGALACVLILIMLKFEIRTNTNENELNSVVAEYIFEDDYFDSDELYVWVD